MAHPPPRLVPSVYIIGAQSTGKTTLVHGLKNEFQSLCRNLGIPTPGLVTEVARTVLKKMSFVTSDIRNSPKMSIMLQEQIMAAQEEAEKAALGTSPWFVSDRSALDPIAFAHAYVGTEAAKQIAESITWQKIRERMAESVVIVCEPVDGWLQDDGVRLLPKDNKEWIQFHHTFCALLEQEGIGYTIIPNDVRELNERVDFVTRRWRELWEEAALPAGQIDIHNSLTNGSRT